MIKFVSSKEQKNNTEKQTRFLAFLFCFFALLIEIFLKVYGLLVNFARLTQGNREQPLGGCVQKERD